MSLNVVGSMAFDAIETPFGKTDKIIGGAATYISLSASYFLPQNINVVSVVGDDFPRDSLDMLNNKGINTEGLEIKKGEKSFFWKGKYHIDMNSRDTLATELNVLENFDPGIPDSYQSSEYLMLGNLTPQVQKKVIRQLKNRPKVVALDTMNFWIDSELEALKEVLDLTDVLIINDEEARQLSDEYSLAKAAQKILRDGPDYLVIKKGEHGALLFHKNQVFFAPALPLEDVFDPTGAGDTFAGGFMGHLAQSNDTSFENMKRSVIYGSAMASFCVESFGTERLQNLKEGEINDRVREFLNLVQVDLGSDHQ